MPIYNFSCATCGAKRDVMNGYSESVNLELVCIACGGTMRMAPSTFHLKSSESRNESASSSSPVKACGHKYHCRCHIKLSKPNPFREKIRAANGIVDKD